MRILVFAPHNDDETLGAGGTIAKYANMGHDVIICEVTKDLENIEEDKLIRKEARNAHRVLGVKDSIFLDLPVVSLKDTRTIEINQKIEYVVRRVRPEIVFIPHKGDMHIDHTEVAKAVMVAVRPLNNVQLKAVYAYETLSETEWNIPSIDNLFIPNVWNPIEHFLQIKIEAMRCYKSQLKSFPHPRSIEAIEALAKFRGSTVGTSAAESFMMIREIL